MATRGSSATATGLAITMIAVGAGVSSAAGGVALLLSFAGVIASAILIFVGIRMADDEPPAPTGHPGVLAAGVLCLRRNLGLVGLLLASAAASVAAAAAAAAERESSQVLCFCAFTLLLSGLTLVNIGVLLG